MNLKFAFRSQVIAVWSSKDGCFFQQEFRKPSAQTRAVTVSFPVKHTIEK